MFFSFDYKSFAFILLISIYLIFLIIKLNGNPQFLQENNNIDVAEGEGVSRARVADPVRVVPDSDSTVEKPGSGSERRERKKRIWI